jgi:hypothetical protein
MTKSEFLDDLKEENRQWESLLAQIGEARMDQPGAAGEWSIKDIVAHLAGWRKWTVLRLKAARAGVRDALPPWPPHLQTDDEINAWIYAENRERSVSDVLQESRQVFQQLLAALEALPEDELMEPNRFPWMEGIPMSAAAFYAHFHEEHEPDMRFWLDRVNDAPQ